MTLIIDKKLSKKELKLAIEKFLEKRKRNGLQKHFNVAVEKIDALEFQRKVRDEWN